ncbi:proteasome assembly chaperone family protein [Halorhabdus sp. CBA1104]|uniref:proteasome assembly chaperone family protein n=1 Tax=Halorhabdus sp. CBA1104 TaxID=1380432 RepID=UPI0012B39091|nr:PAC2 family protein [Halorhabdus sp. CBA1104]QGN06815.1 proteasome assembly chaperone family protein [Halorhabdus sp. CBA1104]
MAHIAVHDAELTLEDPMLVEGFPGAGLVGKIAADHLVDSYEMTHYATCHCEGLPEVAVYHENETSIAGPVRIYADEARELLVLQSDVPVSPEAAEEFAGCVTVWLDEQDALPIYLSGIPVDPDGNRELYGVATGRAEAQLRDHDIATPDERGAISGPTGALLYEATREDLDSIGLLVEASSQFPDPAAAKILLEKGIATLAQIDVTTETLVEQAEEIRIARKKLAKQMQQASDESSKAEPVGMYQ